MSVVSPNPMASRFSATSASHPMMVIAPAPAQAPMNASPGPAKCEVSPMKKPAIAAANTSTRPLRVKPSGMR